MQIQPIIHSKERIRLSGKLFKENLKLRGKVSSLEGENRVLKSLKTKVNNLENFKNKIRPKKEQYEQDLDSQWEF